MQHFVLRTFKSHHAMHALAALREGEVSKFGVEGQLPVAKHKAARMKNRREVADGVEDELKVSW